MKKKIGLLIIVCGLFVSSIQAQDISSDEIKKVLSFKRVYNTMDFGLLIGSSSNEQNAPFSFMNVTSYHLNQQFAVGLGFGTDFYKETYIPVVVDVRYYFRKSKFSPFAYFQAGYAISTESEIHQDLRYLFTRIWPDPEPEIAKPKGGFLINPGIGIRNMFNDHFGVIFTVGYRYQKLNYESDPGHRLELEYNRLNIKFGIIFR